ncbi:hypothetical protein L3Y34_017291 [Caenorhabditis briggsae]|uniref:Uncharacterized protein n=1 Tax=Caenorhabditis briggsae TaxID=6238 RepID=A0AAE9IT51_CAEBR|nr:hypothetical protein L3Y34_017291 [Caenorhabditis briggsae]
MSSKSLPDYERNTLDDVAAAEKRKTSEDVETRKISEDVGGADSKKTEETPIRTVSSSHVSFQPVPSMDYLSIHEDDTSMSSSDRTIERGFSRYGRKRSSVRMVLDEVGMMDRKTKQQKGS